MTARPEDLDAYRRHRLDYLATFKSVPGQQVLHDLQWFCAANETTFRRDPYEAARLAGRREVWLRIIKSLDLTSEQLAGLAREAQVYIGAEDDGSSSGGSDDPSGSSHDSYASGV